MLFEYPDPAEISGIADMGGGNHTRKGNRLSPVKGKPPMSVVEIRHRSGVEECQPVEIAEHIRDVIVLPVDLANSIHFGMALNVELSLSDWATLMFCT